MSRQILKKEHIITDRLTLGPYRKEDRERLTEMMRNPEITATFMVPDYSEEEQFYAYTEQSEESEVSTAGKVMWKTNIISVRKKTSDIHLPFVSCNEDTQDVSINIELEE